MFALAAALLLTPLQDPLEGQMPKNDLGVSAFLEAHPEYDGRGIRVAVFDTGVDPGHPFLQETPDGRRKIVDWYDATTDGRLNTEVVDQVSGGQVIGLSGRQLSMGDHLGAGEVHLGRIDLEFLPGGLQGRVMADRREAWERDRRPYLESVARLEAGGESVDENSAVETELQRQWEDFADEGPVFDVVVFAEGDSWLVIIDSDEDGDLNEERAMRPFKESGDWAVLGDETNLNYAVKVEDEGNRVQMFYDAHGHGTHVAGIIANYEGPDGRLNGIAPGVEIVAVKVGDGKFGGSTYGFAIAKALDFAVEAGCQVANLSFGGPSFYADGHEPDDEIIAEARRRGLILVTSAGNEGPSLTTVGAPATSRHAFTVAAAVWPQTQQSNYSSLAPSDPVLFDFSSRGPLPNGGLGVDFTAPGAALSSLPSWTLSKGENWNGTSMASPQMAGCVALLRCAAAAENLRQTPARIYRAMRLGATKMPQHAWVEVGHGAINMEASLEALRVLDGAEGLEQDYALSVTNPFGVGEGIYQRGLPAGSFFERSVRLAPSFADDASNAEKGDFLRTFRLQSEADWVEVPEAIYTSAQGQRFTVRVHTDSLQPGLHSTRVLLWNADRASEHGPDLILPVTVVVPTKTDGQHQVERIVTVDPGELSRTYLDVPLGARNLVVTVTQSSEGRNEFRTGAGSVSGFRYSEERQQRGRFFLDNGGTYTTRVPVEEGMVVEYALAARWATNRPAELTMHFAFDGLRPQVERFHVPAGQHAGYFAFASLLDDVTGLRASASIDGIAQPIVAEWKIQTDPIRPTVMGDRGMFEAIVTWDQHIPEGTSRVAVVTPDSIQTIEWREDLALIVRNSAGAVVARTIMYETETDLGALEPGDYHFTLRCPSIGTGPLERQFSGFEMHLEQSLPGISLYAELPDLMHDGDTMGRLTIPYRGARTLFAKMPELDALADGAYYYGSVSVRDGSDTLITVPLQIDRPQSMAAAKAAAEEASAESEEPAAGEEERQAYEEAKAAGAENPVAWIAAARDWHEAVPLNHEAALAVLDALVGAGLPDRARAEAASFLSHFPEQAEALRQAAQAWAQ
jgi:subtilisin family serine protease